LVNGGGAETGTAVGQRLRTRRRGASGLENCGERRRKGEEFVGEAAMDLHLMSVAEDAKVAGCYDFYYFLNVRPSIHHNFLFFCR